MSYVLFCKRKSEGVISSLILLTVRLNKFIICVPLSWLTKSWLWAKLLPILGPVFMLKLIKCALMSTSDSFSLISEVDISKISWDSRLFVSASGSFTEPERSWRGELLRPLYDHIITVLSLFTVWPESSSVLTDSLSEHHSQDRITWYLRRQFV